MVSCLSVEQEVLRALHGVPENERWLLALSGGLDSMVLAEILWKWQRRFKVSLAVAHVHHGLGESSLQNRYRRRAQSFVREWATDRSLPFFSNEISAEEGESESALRDYRRRHLRQWLRVGRFDKVVFAHHRDDLLETRLLRLVRGSGVQGLRAMAPIRGRILRPILTLPRADIQSYADEKSLTWVEDPSNGDKQILRNWLRHRWLPELEKKSPGAHRSLARSLMDLSREDFSETIGPCVGLRRAALESLAFDRQTDVVARYFRNLGLKGYSKAHVLELLKRLESGRPSLRFEMLGFTFEATPDVVWASRV